MKAPITFLLARLVRVPSAFAVIACFAALLFDPQAGRCSDAVPAIKGDVLYTQFTLYYEHNEHRTINYRIGTLLPINTQVTFIKADRENIIVKLPDNSKLRIINIPKWTGDDIGRVFTRTFAKEKVDLSKFSDKEQSNILAGTAEVGMSKDSVLKAMGYPPEFRTPSLEEKQWRYWRNRYGTMLINFTDGKVSKIVK